MKKEILRLFHEAGDGFVSGQSLCKQLNVSRQAVWKNIKQLKEYGYEIESVSGKGYRLLMTPDRFYAPEIESYLPADSFCKKIVYYEQIDSTNLGAKRLAEAGAEEGTLVLADMQTAGRGRRGRTWDSEAGVGIWMSLVLRPEIMPERVSGMTLISAMAVNQAIRETCGADCLIKWPNDIVLHGKKICGILTEMSAELNAVHYAVTGIGINANTAAFPPELAEKATSLYLETGKKADRTEIVVCFVDYFGRYYSRYLAEGSLAALVEEYNAMLANRDKQVTIYHGMVEDARQEQISRGIARGIDASGALLVEIDGKQEAVTSGEVSVRGIYGYV